MTEQDADRVTFLFTDIEGSTRLLAELGAGYAAVLDRHRALIQQAIEANEGRVVDMRADEFFAAFADSPRAVQAAVDAQRALGAEQWPAPLRVRMGVHRGRAQPTAGETATSGSPFTTRRASVRPREAGRSWSPTPSRSSTRAWTSVRFS